MKRLLPLMFPLVALLGLGCGSGQPPAFLLDPDPVLVKAGERIELRAVAEVAVSGEPSWETLQLEGGSFQRSQGWKVLYQAPTQAGRYRVAIQGKTPDGQRLRQVVEVEVQPTLSMEPGTLTLPPGAQVTLNARVKGISRYTLTWKVEEEDGGTVNAQGLYTAPARPGTYHVVASLSDPWGFETVATIRVQ